MTKLLFEPGPIGNVWSVVSIVKCLSLVEIRTVLAEFVEDKLTKLAVIVVIVERRIMSPFDFRNNAEREMDEAVEELTEAIRLTVEYVGTTILPPIEGWSWFDALSKYAPEKAQAFSSSKD